MIEAVSSVMAAAPFVRANAEQSSPARSFASSPESIQKPPRAPYISPVISLDTESDKAVLQIRDAETGDVVNQFPSEQTIKARQRAEKAAQQPSNRDFIKELDESVVGFLRFRKDCLRQISHIVAKIQQHLGNA